MTNRCDGRQRATLEGRLRGHAWTLWPWLRHAIAPVGLPASRHWETVIADAILGPVRLSGRWTETPGASAAVVLVHGLGGHSGSHYVLDALVAAQAVGLSVLRLDLRGADLCGEDFYHAALSSDLHATIASPELAGFDDVFVVGFSLGGHVTLHLAAEDHDPRVRAIATVCAPVDLQRSSVSIDHPHRRFYREYVLRGMKRAYAEVGKRRSLPVSVVGAARISTMREWDERIVAPRHGFAGADDYYARASASTVLARIRVPTLAVCAAHDPMVPRSSVEPVLRAHSRITTEWTESGGHVGFPADLDLGFGGGPGLAAQVLAWLADASGSDSRASVGPLAPSALQAAPGAPAPTEELNADAR